MFGRELVRTGPTYKVFQTLFLKCDIPEVGNLGCFINESITVAAGPNRISLVATSLYINVNKIE